MKLLFYVRHGETEMNVAGVFSGHIETNLTDKGKSQAKKSGQDLKQRVPHLDLILVSPLVRARHTAEIIAAEVGYPVDKIRVHDLFKERSFGVLEGTPGDDFYKEHDYKEIDAIENAETIAALHDRAARALAYVRTLPEENILVVSHGSFGRALRRVVNDIPHTHEYDDAHRQSYRMGNAEIVKLI